MIDPGSQALWLMKSKPWVILRERVVPLCIISEAGFWHSICDPNMLCVGRVGSIAVRNRYATFGLTQA